MHRAAPERNGLLTMIGNTPFAISASADSQRMRVMRLVLIVAMLLGAAATAAANDYSALNGPVLRGTESEPPPRVSERPNAAVRFRWEGLYLGGQVGHTMASFDYANGVDSLVNYILRNDVVLGHVQGWTTLPKDDTAALSYGAFIGYNSQWEDAVLGVELNYNRTSLNSSASDTITRSFQDDTGAPTNHHFFYSATIAGNATVRVTDFATVRARAGWSIGEFLPYAFAGLAIGRADVRRSATVTYTRTDSPDDPGTNPPLPSVTIGPTTRSEVANGVFTYGYAAGLGVDVALMPNLFLRAEWEYVRFTSFEDINASFNTARAAIGLKF